MNKRFPVISCLLILTLSSLIGCGGGGGGEDPLPPISVVFTLQAGDEITVEGFISVAPGTFASSTGEVGFAIQDETAGVYVQVSSALGLDLSAFSLGDNVRVTGIVGDLDQLVTLTIDEIADILLLSGEFIFFPQTVDTYPGCVSPREDCSNGIDDDGDALIDCDDPDCSFQSTPELESKIVNLTGSIVVDPDGSGETVLRDEVPGGELFGWKIWLDDGSGVAQTFWHPTADMDPEALTFLTAGTPVRINGFLNPHIDRYEVFPRGDFDVSIPIATARSLPDGEKVLVRGIIGLNPASLEGDFGFSLHEDNGDGTQDGIFVSIATKATVIGNYAGNPMSLDDLIAFVNAGHRKVHVSGVLESTAGGDVVLSPGDGDVRLISEALDFPLTLPLTTGAVSANLGSWVTASGILQTPPVGSSGPFTGWTRGPGGFQARINGGSGPVNVLLPYGAMGDLTGDGPIDFADFNLSLSTPIINFFDVSVGGNLQVAGFARNHDGETEIVVPFNHSLYITSN